MEFIEVLIREGEDIVNDFDCKRASEYVAQATAFLDAAGIEKPYSRMYSYTQSAARYRVKGGSKPHLSAERIRRDVMTATAMLRGLQYKEGKDIAIAKAQSNNVTATASASSTALSFASAISQIDQVGGLDGDVRDEIKGLMEELDTAEGESLKKSAAKKLIDTVIEKAADALPAIAPFVAEAINSTLGG